MSEARRSARHNHLALARQIINQALERGMGQGDHLPEQLFSDLCGVSRTPIRAAYKMLMQNGILSWQQEAGYFLALDNPDELARSLERLEEMQSSLSDVILSDRAQRRIGDVQSVSALARKYDVSRHSVLNALKILSQDGIVTQLPGRAWAFQPVLDSPRAVEESLIFRISLEPDAILSPGFQMDSKKAELIRRRCEDLQALPDGRLSASAFLRVDTDFHSLIAEASANRFARGALLAHHRLRRATQKNMAVPEFRLRQATTEHLDILDSLERRQFDVAADQMTLHLRRSRVSRPDAANRGAPPMTRKVNA